MCWGADRTNHSKIFKVDMTTYYKLKIPKNKTGKTKQNKSMVYML